MKGDIDDELYMTWDNDVYEPKESMYGLVQSTDSGTKTKENASRISILAESIMPIRTDDINGKVSGRYFGLSWQSGHLSLNGRWSELG